MATNDLSATIDVGSVPTNDGSNDFDASIELPPSVSLSAADYQNHLAAGNNHTTVRYFDGHLETAGNDANGLVTDTPTGNFHQIAAGDEFSLALSGGTITGWGNISGVPTASNFVKISAGSDFAVALDDTGHLEGIGSNAILNELPSHGGITDVSAGHGIVLLLMYDGTLKGIGIDAPSGTYTDIAAGGSHAAAVRDDGTINSFGDDTYGQVSNTPTGTFVDVQCGKDFSVGLKSDDKIIAWGRDNYNQIIDYPQYDQGVYDEINTGYDHAVAMAPDGTIKDGTTISFAWGRDDYNQVTDIPEYIGESTYTYVPKVEFTDVTISPSSVESVNPMDVDISGTLSEINSEPIKISYEIYLNGSLYKEVSYLSDAPVDINETLSYGELIFGNNTFELKVYSDETLKTNQAGTVNISKIDNVISEIEFSEDLIAKETLVKALHTNEIIDYIDDEMQRRDVTASGCNSGCASLCQGCSGTCGGNCVGDCAGTCEGSCTGSCYGGCTGGCSGCSDRWF